MRPSEWAQCISTSHNRPAVAMMHRIEDPELGLARGMEDFQHVGNAVVGFGNSFDAGPDLAALGDKVVVGIDH